MTTTTSVSTSLPHRRGLTEQASDAAVEQACRMLRLPTIRANFAEYSAILMKAGLRALSSTDPTATIMADKLLIPLTGGIGVFDVKTGIKQRLIPVARPASVTAVTLAVSGSTIIEQRGDQLVGLGA